MSSESREIKVKRVSSRKRARDNLNSHLTPAKKRGSTPGGQCPLATGEDPFTRTMTDIKDIEVCCIQSINLRNFV